MILGFVVVWCLVNDGSWIKRGLELHDSVCITAVASILDMIDNNAQWLTLALSNILELLSYISLPYLHFNVKDE